MDKHREINWERLAPPGLDGRKTAGRIGSALIGAWVLSLGWLVRLYTARHNLFRLVYSGAAGSQWVLMPERKMTPFYEVLGPALWGFALLALMMLPLAAWHYGYHWVGSRPVYLMRRLPDRRVFHRRCLSLPLLGCTACAAGVLLLTTLYFLIYYIATPRECYVAGQLQMLLANWFAL